MAYSGRFKPKDSQKYRGDPTNIIFRSLWERNVMMKFDADPNVLIWSSEEFVVWYNSPLDGRNHRYFPDFWLKYKKKNGEIVTYLVEVKPINQINPPKIPKRKTKNFYESCRRYAVNKAKWKATEILCEKQGWEFKLLTEKDILPGRR